MRLSFQAVEPIGSHSKLRAYQALIALSFQAVEPHELFSLEWEPRLSFQAVEPIIGSMASKL